MAKVFKYPKCSNILIHEVNLAYRREVVHYLELIRTTYTGRRLLEFIHRQDPRWVVITPVKPAKDHSVNNAYSTPESEDDAYTKDSPIMMKIDVGDTGSIMLPDLRQGPRVGTGAGTNSVIEYHPATWRQFMKNTHRVDPGAGPGELLFHEMIHSMRQMNGRFISNTVAPNLRMDDFEEFCAVLAANLYRQERGFKPLRDSHHGFSAVATPKSFPVRDGKRIVGTLTIEPDPNLSDPAAYYQFYKAQIQQWFASQRAFCIALARSAVSHNPLAIAADDMGISVLNG
jgi:hypothetical protein